MSEIRLSSYVTRRMGMPLSEIGNKKRKKFGEEWDEFYIEQC